MAEYNIAENLESESLDEYSTDVMTGDRNKRMYLYHQLANSLRKAENVDIIVSFLMESGVRLLLNDLENAKLHLDIAKNLNPEDEIVKQLDTMINKG